MATLEQEINQWYIRLEQAYSREPAKQKFIIERDDLKELVDLMAKLDDVEILQSGAYDRI